MLVKNLDPKKVSKSYYIPKRFLKDFSELFADFFCFFYTCLDSGNFNEILETTEIVPICKMTVKSIKAVTDL